jgi:hypothetical protein
VMQFQSDIERGVISYGTATVSKSKN